MVDFFIHQKMHQAIDKLHGVFTIVFCTHRSLTGLKNDITCFRVQPARDHAQAPGKNKKPGSKIIPAFMLLVSNFIFSQVLRCFPNCFRALTQEVP